MRPRGRGDKRTGDRVNNRGTGERVAEPVARVDLAALRQSLTQVITPVTRQAGFDVEAVRVARMGQSGWTRSRTSPGSCRPRWTPPRRRATW